MQLSEEDIKEFIEAWRQDFNETLTVAEARHRASQLLELYLLLARPLPPERREDPNHEPT